MRKPTGWLLGVALMLAVAAMPAGAAGTAEAFLSGLLAPGPAPGTRMVRSLAGQEGTASYDAALAALWLMELNRRDEAGALLAGMAAVQLADGSLPFSFRLPSPDAGATYVRAGATAWVGYAAARYLGDAAGGPHREAIAAMAHRAARYLLARRVVAPGDPREGLVMGGYGRFSYAVADGKLLETFVPGDLTWVSAEHNVDTYFFLRAFGRATGAPRFGAAADDLAKAIGRHLWDDEHGQFMQGIGDGPDTTPALDAASWGAVFLAAVGDRARAERAYAATARYASSDPATRATGHKPYLRRPLIEYRVAATFYRDRLSAANWDQCQAVWPEGSAGVALAAVRLGKLAEARRVLDALEPLRAPSGGLPGLTVDIPLEFSTTPALAGTAWAAMVRSEVEQRPGYVGLWR